MSYLTPAEREALAASKLPKTPPLVIACVSHAIFASARDAGGMRYMGAQYHYVPASDELIRVDAAQLLGQIRKLPTKAKP